MIKLNGALKKHIKGFTLIEVLLALAVFSLAGVALLATSSNHFNQLSQIEKQMYANWVASNKLTEAKLNPKWPPQNNQKGTFEMAGHEWHWLQKVIKTTDNDMRAIVIEVRANEKDEDSLTSFMTYVAKGTTTK